MKAIRYTAAGATLLMALANVPACTASDADVPSAVQWPATVIGLIGLAVVVAFLRRAVWAPSALVAVGLVNAAGGVYAMADGYDGGAVGLALGSVAMVAGAVYLRGSRQLSPSH